MQLTLENPDHTYYLRGADGQAALVNERRLETSFVLAPDHLIENWAVGDVRELSVDDLAPLLALEPELIVLGSGERQVVPPAAA